MQSKVLDFKSNSYIRVNNNFLAIVENNFPKTQINDTINALLNFCLHSAIISHASDTAVQNEHKHVRLTEDTVKISLSMKSVRELFQINRSKSELSNIVNKKTRISEKQMVDIWDKLQNLLGIQVYEKTVKYEGISNLFYSARFVADESYYPFEIIMNREVINNVSPSNKDFYNGYHKILSVPTLILSKRGTYMYYFINQYANVIVNRAWNKYKEYDGHEFQSVIQALGLLAYAQPSNAVAKIRLALTEVNQKTGSQLTVDTVLNGKQVSKLDFYVGGAE